jgi:hypothetical protein
LECALKSDDPGLDERMVADLLMRPPVENWLQHAQQTLQWRIVGTRAVLQTEGRMEIACPHLWAT